MDAHSSIAERHFVTEQFCILYVWFLVKWKLVFWNFFSYFSIRDELSMQIFIHSFSLFFFFIQVQIGKNCRALVSDLLDHPTYTEFKLYIKMVLKFTTNILCEHCVHIQEMKAEKRVRFFCSLLSFPPIRLWASKENERETERGRETENETER